MIREYLKPKSKRVTVNIPDEFVNTGIELLIIPMRQAKRHGDSARLSEMLEKNFKAAGNIRIPKEIDIDPLMNKINYALP
ncbi:hypothetical protein EPICR_170047 [Candidatus Desulfarcum epimagneticum]|uniref:Uncharacterized protein n=1 Tax=uncultured Desulfobacteraceae bacterium TaxID=218296 RepID=A0A484HKL4_9BACT|nr:hypothetical protein EPICR_170047 [uncultured Desulfobacteraceae bacterium]